MVDYKQQVVDYDGVGIGSLDMERVDGIVVVDYSTCLAE